MRRVSSSLMTALIVAALFWGNCLSCPQMLLAAATPLHQQVWTPIVNTLKNGNYTALLYDLT